MPIVSRNVSINHNYMGPNDIRMDLDLMINPAHEQLDELMIAIRRQLEDYYQTPTSVTEAGNVMMAETRVFARDPVYIHNPTAHEIGIQDFTIDTIVGGTTCVTPPADWLVGFGLPKEELKIPIQPNCVTCSKELSHPEWVNNIPEEQIKELKKIYDGRRPMPMMCCDCMTNKTENGKVRETPIVHDNGDMFLTACTPYTTLGTGPEVTATYLPEDHRTVWNWDQHMD